MSVPAWVRHSTAPIPVTPAPADLVTVLGVEPHLLVELPTGQWRHRGSCPCGFGAAVMLTRRDWSRLARWGRPVEVA